MKYKLTNSNGQTKGGLQWGDNIRHEAIGSLSQGLCSDGWIHWYDDLALAAFMNPIHANYSPYRVWEGEPDGIELREVLKSGSRGFTTLKELIPIEVTVVNMVAFGILSSLEVYDDNDYVNWAKLWLDAKDRSFNAANTAANTTAHAAYAVAQAAARAANTAAQAANTANTANTAARTAALAAHAADAVSYVAAYAVAYVAVHAADAANTAAYVTKYKKIDFVSIARKALTII